MQRTSVERRSLLTTLCVYLVSRIVVLFAAHAATWYHPPLSVKSVLGTGWDGAWYLFIAESGYPDHVLAEGPGNRWAFFPVLPAAVRGTRAVTGLDLALSGIFVSLIVGAVAVVLVHLMVRELFGSHTARHSAALLAFFPTAFVFGMSYTEGLFIAAAAFCLLGVMRQRWGWAATGAVIGVLTRVTGLVLIAVLAVEVIMLLWRSRSALNIRALIGPAFSFLAALAAFAGYCLYQWRVSGDPLAFISVQEHWGKEWRWDSTPPAALFRIVTEFGSTYILDWLSVLALLWVTVAAAAGIVLARKGHPIPISWWVYSLGCIAIAFSGGNEASVLRYTMAAFPLLAVIVRAAPRSWITGLVSTSATLQGVLGFLIFAGVTFKANTLMAP